MPPESPKLYVGDLKEKEDLTKFKKAIVQRKKDYKEWKENTSKIDSVESVIKEQSSFSLFMILVSC